MMRTRSTPDRFDVRVVGVVREAAFDLLILLVAVVAQAPVALGAVFVAQGVGVEGEAWGGGRLGRGVNGHGAWLRFSNGVVEPVCRNCAAPR
jgi:hypothetical protein